MDMTLSEFFSQTTRIISYEGTTWIENDPISRVYKYVFMYYTGKYVVIPSVKYVYSYRLKPAYSYGLKYFYNVDHEFDDVNQNNAETQTSKPKTYFG